MSDDAATIDLDALERALVGAVPGPLEACGPSVLSTVVGATEWEAVVNVPGQPAQARHDAALIVAAVNALPALIAELRALRARAPTAPPAPPAFAHLPDEEP